ncbi:hypothetical protein J2Z48_001875 [Croceifilum oryzae]|uniref:N,N-dimethylformamidase beta subunit-like C-terminal domain-containing protein n=1 Tax=Croceifilum oryzae TaxID=1553429 RepID=A0AAJ1WQM2_9BACL|nr:N,N-dimethylformamidase beta subunit family domain-containing protein [Croceifilum oryzae]MDQ0417702.1 hypothetical protein [Croceifilum oryzae]
MTRRSVIKSIALLFLSIIAWQWKWLLSKIQGLLPNASSTSSVAMPTTPESLPSFQAKQLLYQFKVKGQAPAQSLIELRNKNDILFSNTIKLSKEKKADYPHVAYSKEQDVSIVTIALSPEYDSYPDLKVEAKGIAIHDQRVVRQTELKMLENTHPIEGYTPKISYQPGEKVEFKVHTQQKEFNLVISRFGLEEKVLYQKTGIKGATQNYPAYAYREGCNWQTSFEFTIPEDWESGMYAAKVWDESKREFYITWIVRPKPMKDKVTAETKKKRIAMLSATNTWQAYNPWGGASLYTYKRNPRFQRYLPDQIGPRFAQYVTTQRPNPEGRPVPMLGQEPTHLASGERYVFAWFEREKIPFDLYSDMDFHQNPHLLDSYGTLCIQTHNEYWTKEMYDQLEKFVDRGGNLIYLCGNGVYWKMVINNDLMEVRKDNEMHMLNGEMGGTWRSVKRPESRLLGVRYTTPGITTFAPYRVLNPEHWIFEGTGVKKGDLMGKEGPRGPASGHETDKRDGYSPKNVILLAKGLNPDEDPLQKSDGSLPVETEKGMEVGKGGGEIIYYDHAKGGGVYSVGSTTYGTSMWVDPVLSRMLRNVLKRFTGL